MGAEREVRLPSEFSPRIDYMVMRVSTGVGQHYSLLRSHVMFLLPSLRPLTQLAARANTLTTGKVELALQVTNGPTRIAPVIANISVGVRQRRGQVHDKSRSRRGSVFNRGRVRPPEAERRPF